MYRMTSTHSMLGLKNVSGCVQARLHSLIPLFEAVPRLHTVIEISDKNPSNFQIGCLVFNNLYVPQLATRLDKIKHAYACPKIL